MTADFIILAYGVWVSVLIVLIMKCIWRYRRVINQQKYNDCHTCDNR